jgi:diguanylate cyclase (GGDEF)-like protein
VLLWVAAVRPHAKGASDHASLRPPPRFAPPRARSGTLRPSYVGSRGTPAESKVFASVTSLASKRVHEIDHAILEASCEGILATDDQGRVLAHNQRFLSMWGVEEAWLRGSHPHERIEALAARTRDPAVFRADIMAALDEVESVPAKEVCLLDGRVLVRVCRDLVLPGRHGRVFAYRDVTDARREVVALRASEVRLGELATQDALTGLLNRRALLEALDGLLPSASRRVGDRPIAVLMIDLDEFKLVNDAHGHAAGDAVLRDFGEVLRGRLRRGDVAGRYGGEEFVVVASVRDRAAAQALAEEIRARAAGGASGVVPYRVSIGLALAPDDAATSEAVLGIADQRLYQAKREGRDRVVG